MFQTPFYDPKKSYEENFENGPFGEFAERSVFNSERKTEVDFLGSRVNTPFGIPAGPLVNGRFVRAALDKGFDIVTYKTVRSSKYPCHPWPNVVSVKLEGDLSLEKAEQGLVVSNEYKTPLSITNSFGVPSFNPDFWQKDLAEVVKYSKGGQVVIGSFQGTPQGNAEGYIKDFSRTAKLAKETGAKILEVNLSCPNEGTGHLLCFDLERTRQVVEAVKNEIGNTPLIIKIAYFKDQEEFVKLIEAVGEMVEGVEAINTIGSKILNEKGLQALPGEGRLRSGVCGAGIKWAGLEMVSRLKTLRQEKGMKFGIIGVGGVMEPKDYAEYRNAGADAVLSATGAMWNPFLAQEIKETISAEGGSASGGNN
jgi:dihydroorotate dehydrogenase (NAD+) catalytic subunit